jgi:Family of unknown function (DUF6339)
MNLHYFSRPFVERLRSGAEANSSKYGSDSGWVDHFAAGGRYLLESHQIVGPPPELAGLAGSAEKYDAENARHIWEWLGPLSPALAVEERLWACLTHVVFAEYMAARWPVDGPSVVHRRFLFEGQSFAALTRNGIARLWWGASLTRDAERENAFELTSTLFLRQDIQVSLLERSFGKCRTVRMGVLDFLRLNRDWLGPVAFGKRIQAMLKELNLLGGVLMLDALAPDDIAAQLTRIAERLAGPRPSDDGA